MLEKITTFSMNRPWTLLAIILIITIVFAVQFPKIKIDTDPENMLEPDQPDRVLYNEVKDNFGVNATVSPTRRRSGPDSVLTRSATVSTPAARSRCGRSSTATSSSSVSKMRTASSAVRDWPPSQKPSMRSLKSKVSL